MRLPALFLAVSILFAAACGSSSDPAGSGGDAGHAGNNSTGGTGGNGGNGNTGGNGGNGAGPGTSCDEAEMHAGDGTFYGADGSGNCSFDPTGDLMVAAMNHTDYAGSAACGACAHIVGPSGEVTVRIVDRCPECPQGDIDLSAEAFEKIADPSLGRVDIQWSYVPSDVAGPIVYHFKEGSNQWWTAVQIRSARYAISRFEVEKNGAFVEVGRLDYNYFVDDAGMGPGPYTFRVTDVEGNVLTDSGVPFIEAGDAPGAAQFPACAP